MTRCEYHADVGAYVLKALDEDASVEFAAHLETCEACRREAAELQMVADTLPLAAPQVAPSRAVRDRIMAVAESEAELLRATDAAADRTPADVAAERRRRRWLPRPALRPALAFGSVACAAVVAVIVATSGGGPESRTVSASLAPAGAKASVKVTGHRAELSVAGMPSPAGGKVYEVWLVRAGQAPQATHALFGVRGDGRAVVEIPEPVADADAIWVTAEPSGGSSVPTSAPVIKAALS